MTPDVLQFTLKFTNSGQQCMNVLYAQRTNSGGDPQDWNTDDVPYFLEQVYTAYVADYIPLTAHDCFFDGIDWVFNSILNSGPLIEGTDVGNTYPIQGGEPHDGCANNVSLAIKLATGFGGRSYHGRFYFNGINNGLYDVDNPNFLKPGSVGDFNSAGGDFLTSCTVSYPSDDGFAKLVVASFIHNGSLRSSVLVNDVTAIVLTDSTFDSQRRRLPGRGT